MFAFVSLVALTTSATEVSVIRSYCLLLTPFDFLCAARICALINIVHKGNTIAIDIQFEMVRRRVRPQANPENAIQREKIPVRKAMTHVEKMKTPPP